MPSMIMNWQTPLETGAETVTQEAAAQSPLVQPMVKEPDISLITSTL